MQRLLNNLATALALQDGKRLARTLSNDPRGITTLEVIRVKNVEDFSVSHIHAASWLSLNNLFMQRKALDMYTGTIDSPWDEIAIALLQVITYMNDRPVNSEMAYREQAILVKCVTRRKSIYSTKLVLQSFLSLFWFPRTLVASGSLSGSQRLAITCCRGSSF